MFYFPSATPSRISGRTFDEIIIRSDKYLRGRQPEEIVKLLSEGIDETKPTDIPVKVILKESEAIDYAYQHAKPGSLITIMCDVVTNALEQVRKLKEAEDGANL